MVNSGATGVACVNQIMKGLGWWQRCCLHQKVSFFPVFLIYAFLFSFLYVHCNLVKQMGHNLSNPNCWTFKQHLLLLNHKNTTMNIFNHKAFLKIFAQETIPGSKLINESEHVSSKLLTNSSKGSLKETGLFLGMKRQGPKRLQVLSRPHCWRGSHQGPHLSLLAPGSRSFFHLTPPCYRPRLRATDPFSQHLRSLLTKNFSLAMYMGRRWE